MENLSPIQFEGHVPADTPDRYHMLPFNVPAHTARVDIAYVCTPDLSDIRPRENPLDFVADLGVFDSRGAEFMGAGYRGTSGNSRSAIFIAADDATPGYSSGTLPPGEWNIMLGFFRFGPKGCGYRVEISLTPGDPITAEPLARLPLRTSSDRSPSATGWYKGELHCHTIHSDGADDPLAVVTRAEELGLDFLAITDHNTFTQQIPLNSAETDVILIPGCEVTTSYGHWNIWGDSSGGWIEFRVNNTQEIDTTIQQAVRRGYLTSCNHPRPNGPAWRFTDAEGYSCVEVWNGRWENLNETCLAFWVERINQGKRLVAVAGSDCHEINTTDVGEGLARPTTVIYCEGAPSAAALLTSLRAGHDFVTHGPEGPQLRLTSGSAMMGDAVDAPASGKLPISVRIIDGDGGRLEICTAQGVVKTETVSGKEASFEIDVDIAQTPYVRVQLRDPATNNMLALTNPIYLDRT